MYKHDFQSQLFYSSTIQSCVKILLFYWSRIITKSVSGKASVLWPLPNPTSLQNAPGKSCTSFILPYELQNHLVLLFNLWKNSLKFLLDVPEYIIKSHFLQIYTNLREIHIWEKWQFYEIESHPGTYLFPFRQVLFHVHQKTLS